MAKTEEEVAKDQSLQEIIAELEAMPPNSLRGEALLAMAKRIPKLGNMPEGWTSADDIREFRGPLPEDDPDFQRNILGRR